MPRDRYNLFDELLHAIHIRGLVEDMYNQVRVPTLQHAEQHVLGSVDWNFEIQLIIKEIQCQCETR